LQSGVTVPAVPAHVFSQYLKGLVDLRVEVAWYKHRSELAAGETETLKGQFAPQGLAARGLELITGHLARDLRAVFLRRLFHSPPQSAVEVKDLLRTLFTAEALPARFNTK
jgi:hypothetical protein